MCSTTSEKFDDSRLQTAVYDAQREEELQTWVKEMKGSIVRSVRVQVQP